MHRFDVLPALGQKGGQEVECLGEVLSDLLLVHGVDGDALSQPGELLHSESDGAVELVDLVLDVLVLADGDGQLADGGDVPTDELGDVPGKGVRHHQHVVLTGPLLDQLGLVVELLELIKVDRIDVDLLGLLDVGHGSDEADFQLALHRVAQSSRGVKPLLFFGVVVSQHHLQVDGLHEVPLLALFQCFADNSSYLFLAYLGHSLSRFILISLEIKNALYIRLYTL